ncbi:hypothetical protein K456DRAFT_59727, partial [Colletotrichum gloeosporioides 23]
MAAHCRTTTGNWTWSVLDLNHCLLNNYGYLMAQDEGYFFKSAAPCVSDNTTTSWANYQCSTEFDENSGRHVSHGIDLSKAINLLCYRPQLTFS